MDLPLRSRPRRGAHTPRGRETRSAILKAARRMCSEQWLDQLSLAELAREAGTTRASVLFQFPDGWPDIAAELMIEELEAAQVAAEEIAGQRLKAPEALRRSLHYFLERGESLGALPANVRAFSYFWGEAIDALVAPTRDAILGRIARLLQAVAPGRQTTSEARDSAEVLVHFALDLVAAPMFRRLESTERAARLDSAINLMIKGLTRK